MKTIYFILGVFLCSSCVDSNRPNPIFKLINKTSYTIVVKPFARNKTITGASDSLPIFNGGFKKGETILLSPNETKNFERNRSDSYQFYSVVNVDSVRVIFDEEKLMTQVCNGGKLTCNTDLVNGSSIYTFTESDYQNAEDCDGKCE